MTLGVHSNPNFYIDLMMNQVLPVNDELCIIKNYSHKKEKKEHVFPVR